MGKILRAVIVLSFAFATTTHAFVLQFEPQASIVNLDRLSIGDDTHRLSYGAERAVPAIFLNLGTPLLDWRVYHVFAEARVGYMGMRGLSTVSNANGADSSLETSVYCLPVTAGLRLEYWIHGFEHATPSLAVNAGYAWLTSTGATEGARQNHWVPIVTISPMFNFLNRKSYDDWFGGFSFGPTFQTSLSSEQVLRAWSIDLKFNYRL